MRFWVSGVMPRACGSNPIRARAGDKKKTIFRDKRTECTKVWISLGAAVKLYDQVREKLRMLPYALDTEKSYLRWIDRTSGSTKWATLGGTRASCGNLKSRRF